MTEVIRLSPSCASWAYERRGSCWGDLKEFDKAIADFAEAIRLDPKSAESYVGHGLVLHEKGDYDNAIMNYNEAIRLDPTNDLAYVGRGQCRYAKGEYEAAISNTDEALRINPTNSRAWYIRAWIYAACPDTRVRDAVRAVEAATRACELSHWSEADPLAVLAAAKAESGDFESAMKWQTKANEMTSDPEKKTEGERRLELYRAKQPYREPETR